MAERPLWAPIDEGAVLRMFGGALASFKTAGGVQPGPPPQDAVWAAYMTQQAALDAAYMAEYQALQSMVDSAGSSAADAAGAPQKEAAPAAVEQAAEAAAPTEDGQAAGAGAAAPTEA